MRDDDERKKAAPVGLVSAQELQAFSVDELEARVQTLKEQIAQCEAQILAKRAHRGLADQLFSPRGE